MELLLALFVVILFWGKHSTSSKHILCTSDCEGKCVTAYRDLSVRRDMSKTFQCKDCYPKLKQTLDSAKCAVGGSKIKFESVEKGVKSR